MANNLDGVRDALFKTLRALQDKDNPMDIDRAKAVSDVAQTIINTAKVEVDFMRVTGQTTALPSFITGKEGQPPQVSNTPTGTKSVTHDQATGVTSTVHRMRG